MLLGVIVGTPALLLVGIGSPLPSSLPSSSELSRALASREVSAGAVITVLAAITWMAWARITAAVAIELVAHWRGVTAPHLALLGSSQRWAASLVSGAMVLLPGLRPVGAAEPAGRPEPTVAVSLLEDARVVVQLDRPTHGPARTAESTWLVRRHDSWWSIAERALGDGARWREIVAANVGRSVSPGVVFDGSIDRLLEGWVLTLPETDGARLPDTSATVVVAAGDTLSSIAARQYGDASRWTELWTANAGRAFDGRTFDDPSLILPGWRLDAPMHEAPASTASGAEPPPPGDPVIEQQAPSDPANGDQRSSEAPPSEAPSSEARRSEPPRRESSAIEPEPATTVEGAGPHGAVTPTWVDGHAPSGAPVGVGGAVVLSAGVVGVVHLRRQQQLRRATVRSRLAAPAGRAVQAELTLRALDRPTLIARIDLAMRAAAAGLLRTDARPLGLLVGPDGRIIVLLSGWAHSAPPPWSADPSGERWVLPATATIDELAEAARHVAVPCPALCHIGDVNGDLLMVDLEALGLLVVDGPEKAAQSIVRAMAAALAVSPLAETSHLIVTGLEQGATLSHPQGHHACDIDAALDLAAVSLGSTIGATGDGASTFDLRVRHTAGEAWEPAIVLASGQPLPHSLGADLVEMCSPPRRGLAVVLDRAVAGTPWSLRCDDHGRWRLLPLDLELRPIGITADDVVVIGELIAEASAPLVEGSGDEDASSDGGGRSAAAFRERDWALAVRLLGEVDVVDRDGRAALFERSKALELVAWLSQHRAGATRARARTALWDVDVRDATFANVVSDARRALGKASAPAGGEWIARTLTEALPLDPLVVTDADLLADRLAHARGCDAADALAILRPGVELIRGSPLSGTAYTWADAEGITSSLVLLATSAAAELAAACLRLGDIEGVFWATGRGLAVLPGHEELIGLRMRAHAQAGDRSGVRAEWAAYERSLTADPWSDGVAAPKLVALRHDLLTATYADAGLSAGGGPRPSERPRP